MKTLEQLQKKRKLWDTFTWIIIAFAVACLIGLVVCLVLFGLNKADAVLMGILGGSFAGGAVIFGGLGFLFFRLGEKIAAEELDALELADGPYSFFVGEGTFATFKDDVLFVHGAAEDDRKIIVPYYDLRFFSVCTRRAPREHGHWSVVIEIPARYLNKGATREMQPVLIQTDGKERLYARIKELGREIIGDLPEEKSDQEQGEKSKEAEKKFTRVHKYTLPDTRRRTRSFVLMIFAVLLLVGGIVASIYWQPTFGSVIIVLGAYVGIRAMLVFFRSKAEFSVYEEGIYYREPTGMDNVFLKWDEFSLVKPFQYDGKTRLRVTCPYGAYEFPYMEGAYEYIKERYPDKCEE